MQLQLDTKKTCIMALLALFAFSSLGFAVFGLIMGPDHRIGLERRSEVEVEIRRPQVPDLEEFVQVWHGAGYDLFKREQNCQLQPAGQAAEPWAWIQCREQWVLVPREPGLDLTGFLFQLCSAFLEEGWALQLEAAEYGYTLGFWSHVQGSSQRVLALEWQLEELNPRNYREHAAGLVPVLGEYFDPLGFARRTPQAPVLAIIIDDWGHHSPAAEPLIAFPLPLTVAVLPQLDLTVDLALKAQAAGHEVILHQPMEALDTSLPLGPGGIYREMEPGEVDAVLRDNLARLPMAVGVSNHMGSLVTEDPQAMESILRTVGEQGLFFVDSRTSSRSVVAQTAGELGVPYGVNDLFIDNENDPEQIKGQLRAGLSLAQRRGYAVVIGHVRPATAQALWEMVPELLSSGVELVPISRVLFSSGGYNGLELQQ